MRTISQTIIRHADHRLRKVDMMDARFDIGVGFTNIDASKHGRDACDIEEEFISIAYDRITRILD